MENIYYFCRLFFGFLLNPGDSDIQNKINPSNLNFILFSIVNLLYEK